jgi:APA family basic amino acid/polyamine antiporter
MPKLNGLSRQLNLFDSIMVMMGIIIGSGIFLTTGIMAKTIPSPLLILLAWFVGGVLTLAGALTYAELGASMPRAGGQYVYLKEAYGPLVGFLYGWITFLVYMTGGIAALAIAFAEYFGYLIPVLSTDKICFSLSLKIVKSSDSFTFSMAQLTAVFIILFLSLVNYLGLRFGKSIQNIITVVKIATLAGFILMGGIAGRGRSISFALNPSDLDFSQLVIGFGLALIAVFWAFDGWNNINFVAGEITNPGRNIPRALFIGTIGITVLYVLVNYIYLYSLPVTDLSGVVRVAEKSASALFGGHWGVVVSIVVIVSTFGSLNGSILTGPRVYYAMARDGLFFSRVARVNPRFKTPGFAIAIQALWSSILVCSGSFEQIITFAMFISIAFWIAAAAAVFKLRRKYPSLDRPYKTWGYPVIPLIFILASSGILLNTLIEKPVESLAGVGLAIIGIPAYYIWKRG